MNTQAYVVANRLENNNRIEWYGYLIGYCIVSINFVPIEIHNATTRLCHWTCIHRLKGQSGKSSNSEQGENY